MSAIDILLLHAGDSSTGDALLERMRASHQGASSKNEISSSETTPLHESIPDADGSTVIETRFEDNSKTYRILDISRQKGDRRKFLHFFEKVPAILFISPLTAYDQKIEDDASDVASSGLVKSLELFRIALESEWFTGTPIILLLTEMDAFEARLPESPLEAWFPEYEGGTLQDACSFLLNRFVSINQKPDRVVYADFSGSDTARQFKFVQSVMSDVLASGHLRTPGPA